MELPRRWRNSPRYIRRNRIWIVNYFVIPSKLTLTFCSPLIKIKKMTSLCSLINELSIDFYFIFDIKIQCKVVQQYGLKTISHTETVENDDNFLEVLIKTKRYNATL